MNHILFQLFLQALEGPRTIHEKVTIQSLRRMSPKVCRSFPFLDNSDQHYIVLALKRCVELLVNLCRFLVTYLYIARGPALDALDSSSSINSGIDNNFSYEVFFINLY